MSEKPLFKQCPNCQQFTPEKGSVCIHCEYQFAPPEVPQKKKGRTCGIWVLGVLAVLGLVFVACVVSFALSEDSSTSTYTATPRPATNTPTLAEHVASEFGKGLGEGFIDGLIDGLSARPATNTPIPPLAEPTAISTPTVAVHTATARPATNAPIPPLAEPTATNTPTVSRFTVTGNVVNVRQGPDTTFEIIGTVNQGMQFDIIGKNQTGDWYQFCCVNNEQGWIFGELVEIENPLIVDKIRVGDVHWRVLAAHKLGNTLQSDNRFIDDATTRGQFIQVRFEIENLSNDLLTFIGVPLRDNQEREYSEYSERYFFIQENERCSWENLNPNIPMICTTIYEVAVNATGLAFIATDLEPFEFKEAEIDLNLPE